jgi:hypothetical protein
MHIEAGQRLVTGCGETRRTNCHRRAGEEAVRLDVRHAENGTLSWDRVILLSTAIAVFCSSGAY